MRSIPSCGLAKIIVNGAYSGTNTLWPIKIGRGAETDALTLLRAAEIGTLSPVSPMLGTVCEPGTTAMVCVAAGAAQL